MTHSIPAPNALISHRQLHLTHPHTPSDAHLPSRSSFSPPLPSHLDSESDYGTTRHHFLFFPSEGPYQKKSSMASKYFGQKQPNWRFCLVRRCSFCIFSNTTSRPWCTHKSQLYININVHYNMNTLMLIHERYMNTLSRVLVT